MDLLYLRSMALALLKAPLRALRLSSVCDGSLGLSWSLFLLSLSRGFRQNIQPMRQQGPRRVRTVPGQTDDRSEEAGSPESSLDTVTPSADSVTLSAVADVVLGVLLAAGVLLHVEALGWCIDRAGAFWYQDVVTSAVAFLTSEPIGMKLNDELAGFMGACSRAVFDSWTSLLSQAHPRLSQAVVASAGLAAATLGASFAVSLLADFLLLATTPLFLTALPVQGLFRLQLATIVAFGRLSTGVKWNPLQERADSVTSSTGQLVLSALLFTSAFLLLPTTALFFLSLLLPCLAVALTRHTLFLTSRYLSSLPVQYLLSFPHTLSTPLTSSAPSQVTTSPSLDPPLSSREPRSPAPSTQPALSLADVARLLGPLLSGQRLPLFQTKDLECVSAPP